MTLLENTQALLKHYQKASGKSLAEIHKDLDDEEINRNWFYKFAAGDIDDPSVNRVQRVHDRLKYLAFSN